MLGRHKLWIFFSMVAVLCLGKDSMADARWAYDPDPAWPLCGRIAQDPPAGWDEFDGCPESRHGNARFSDAPFSSTFGPRQKASEDYRYDFHRGLDIPAEIGTPVFAIADGVVKKAGSYFPVYTDPLVQLRHYRPGYNGSCRAGGGCYVSNYMHLSDWTVAVGEHVVKGQLIGYTGASSSGFAHLHFEVRDAPSQDPYSAWSRDAIHPLRVLPYADTGTSTMKVGVDDVDSSDPMNPKVTVSVRMANTVELDLSRVEVRVYGKTADGALNWVGQPGETAVGHTPEGTGYHVYPAWFDVFDWNRQYTHKNSRKVRWSSFAQGGSNECPFWSDHPAAYDANVHLDRQDPSNPRAGYFNGIAVSPAPFNARSEAYVLSLRFEELIGVADAANLCVKARAVDVLGNATPWVEYHCH